MIKGNNTGHFIKQIFCLDLVRKWNTCSYSILGWTQLLQTFAMLPNFYNSYRGILDALIYKMMSNSWFKF